MASIAEMIERIEAAGFDINDEDDFSYLTNGGSDIPEIRAMFELVRQSLSAKPSK